MSEEKNINTESAFEDRTGLVVWLKSKRNVKRLMNFGFLHYVSSKMDYALLYVDADKVDSTIEKLKKEHYVKYVEKSNLRDLPSSFDNVLEQMQKEIDDKKREEKIETYSKGTDFNTREY